MTVVLPPMVDIHLVSLELNVSKKKYFNSKLLSWLATTLTPDTQTKVPTVYFFIIRLFH